MKILSLLLLLCGFPCRADNAYLEQFMAFSRWSQELPAQPDEAFLTFVDKDNALATKLREKWLYQLGRQKDWVQYKKHYRFSKDVNLQCWYDWAVFQETGRFDDILGDIRRLWLTGESQPAVCNTLFDEFKKSQVFNERLIDERIALALDHKNMGLARYLLKQYQVPKSDDEKLLTAIVQNPRAITQLEPGGLHGIFYLYGLKRLVSVNMTEALTLWKNPKTRKMLNHKERDVFLNHLSLYKAMRNHEDMDDWFAKITTPEVTLLDWQIRLAMKREDWKQVAALIQRHPEPENPCWQYWLARALENTGYQQKADEIYHKLAGIRQYYGFLSSFRLKQSFAFHHDKNLTPGNIMAYSPILKDIKFLYRNKRQGEASRLLNDFISGLPVNEKVALLNWVASELKWYGKTVYLSNTDELTNQLSLRFPMPLSGKIKNAAKSQALPASLVYAIIRQESSFREDAVSVAGARGLMQLMPATASVVAKQKKIAYHDKNQLFIPETNVTLGIAYLEYLARHFSSHPVLMVAAYNAGPHQVNYWIKNHPPKEVDVWIETLPWRETRNYLKNVISFNLVYQYRLQQKPDLTTVLNGF